MGTTRQIAAQQSELRERNDVLAEWRVNLKRAARRILSRSVTHRADTSDVVQEGLIQIWQSLDNIYGESPAELESLTHKVAKGHAHKLERKHYAKKRSVKHTVPVNDDCFTKANDPFDDCVKNEEAVAMIDALERLKPDHQQILRLVFFEGKSLAEVSRELEKTYKSTRGLFERSLEALRVQVCSS